jgi:hypothetical protein
MRRRGLLVTGASLVAFSMVSTVLYRINNTRNNASNDLTSLKEKVLNSYYVNSSDTVRKLKKEIGQNITISQEDNLKFSKVVIEKYRSLSVDEFKEFVDNSIKDDFRNKRIYLVNQWYLSEFESKFWFAFG